MTGLPPPAACSWLDADEAACLLEDLANRLDEEAGRSPAPQDGAVKLARWLGKKELVRSVRRKAAGYRRRQALLLHPTEPPC